MIRLSYALKIARTKFHSRRGILVASILVASLLFGALFAMVFVFTGAEKSAVRFVNKAGNDRYLVKAYPNIPIDASGFSQPLSLNDVRAITAFEQNYYQTLRAKYASLGLSYDMNTEIPALQPASWLSKSLPDEQRVTINWSSPAIIAMKAQKFVDYTKTATNKLSDLKSLGNKYGASGYFLVDKPSLLPQVPGLRLLENGKEDFGDSELKAGDASTYGYYVNSIHNGSYSFTDQSLLNRYLQINDATKLKGIPVVVSAQEAAALFGEKFGIGKEPATASAKFAWLKDVQTKLSGQTYQVCYRNQAEQGLLEKIQRDYVIANSAGSRQNTTKQDLIYDYPAQACGDIVTKTDTRTSSEKQADAKAIETQKKLGTYVAPIHRVLTFEVVGIKYIQPYTNYTNGIDDYVKSLVAPQDEATTLEIPIQMYKQLPDELTLSAVQNSDLALVSDPNDDFAARVLEFPSIDAARSFLSNETCPSSASVCSKKFIASTYGSNYLIVDEIGKMFGRVATVAFPIVLGLAMIIIWLTVSRIIAENRKETAIFRAIGAKRGDIAAIYIIYVIHIALLTLAASVIFGITIAFAVDTIYGKQLKDIAVMSFGIVSNAPQVSLFNISSPLSLLIAASIFIISVIACVPALVRNVRRSPIRDIRDE